MIKEIIENYVNFSSEEKNDLIKFVEKENFDNHSLSVAKILIENNADYVTVLSGLYLSKYREDSEVIKDKNLPIDCETILSSLLKIENINLTNDEISTENIKNLLISIANDIRVILIKLADVVAFAKEIDECLDAKSSAKISHDEAYNFHTIVKELYAPISARLGLSNIKSALLDYNIRFFHKSEYDKIGASLDEFYRNRYQEIEINISKIKNTLNSLNIKSKVYGRIKHISSIFNKLKDKNKTLAQIYDLLAIRVICQTKDECYEVLSIINSLYEPIDGRFKDYISRPKQNGYQSIHTTVITENNDPLEIQIRTQEMHDFAEYGIAAHFLYKEKKTKESELDKKLIWVKKLLENTEFSSASDYLTELKNDLYASVIFVQTPLGKVISLKENSSPIDFAYCVHTEVGNKCVGAKVNGKLVPLNSTLKNGDVVEIITSQNGKPSRDWLKIITTKEARSKLNSYFKNDFKEENIKRGKLMLEATCKNKHIEPKSLLCYAWLKELFDKWTLKSLDDLYACIGHGTLTSTQVVNKLLAKFRQQQKISSEIKATRSHSGGAEKDVEFENGISGLLIRFAKCCLPVPGDEIVGFISRGKGITIHAQNCPNVASLAKDRLIKASFVKNSNNKFNSHLIVQTLKSSNVILNITKILLDEKINMTGLNTTKTSDQQLIDLYVDVKNLDELNKLMQKIKKISGVYEVERSKGE